MAGFGICRIGIIGVPLRMSKKCSVQSKQLTNTYFAHKQKLTTDEPTYVSHVYDDDLQVILLTGPDGVLAKLFEI